MAYGYSVKNYENRTVISSEDPALLVLDKGTLQLDYWYGPVTTTTVTNATLTDSWLESVEIHRGTIPSDKYDPQALFFLECPANGRVHITDDQVWASSSSIRWVKCQFAGFLPPPTIQWGLLVYDQNGNMTYSSQQKLVEIAGVTGNHTGNSRWVFTPGNFLFQGNPSYQATIGGVKHMGASGGMVSQGLRPGNAFNGAEGRRYDQQRFRGLVANINWNSI